MIRKIIAAFVLAATFAAGLSAQDNNTVQLKPYGFIRNYLVVDSRESVYGTDDFFYYVPKDEAIVNGMDTNAQTNVSFGAITSRLGLDVTGYQVNGWNVAAKFEDDFYDGVTGVTGTALLRLRQAYVTFGKNGTNIKVGQAWHPMAADMPHVFSLNTGAPFGPFSRTPEVVVDGKLSDSVTLTGAIIWQMQYTSTGPEGASANYIKYGGIPELYLGLSLKKGGFTGRVGVDMLSIKPRHRSSLGNKVSDRLTTFSPFLYAEYTKGMFSVKAKTILAQAGEHMSLNGGYGVTDKSLTDDSWQYAPTRNSSTWVSLTYGKKVQAVLFGGYVRNFGTAKPLLSPGDLYFSKNSFFNMRQMFRLTPELMFNWGKVTLGLEYELTGVQYGSFGENDKYGLANQGVHWVVNNRFQVMVRYSF